jgi:hypothetical protein
VAGFANAGAWLSGFPLVPAGRTPPGLPGGQEERGMGMRRMVMGSLRLAAGLMICASTLLGCATGQRQTAQDSVDAGWEPCNPPPPAGFFLVCWRR